MSKENDPQSSVNSDGDAGQDPLEVAEARRIILARRAQYVALAIAAAGAVTAACGGETDNNGNLHPCLTMSIVGGMGGGGGLEPPLGGNRNVGGSPMHPCLSPVFIVGGTGGAGGSAAGTTSAGGMRVCLSPPRETGGQRNLGGAQSSGGASAAGSGAGGGMRVCLSAPPLPIQGGSGNAGSGGTANGGRAAGGMGPCLSVVK